MATDTEFASEGALVRRVIRAQLALRQYFAIALYPQGQVRLQLAEGAHAPMGFTFQSPYANEHFTMRPFPGRDYRVDALKGPLLVGDEVKAYVRAVEAQFGPGLLPENESDFQVLRFVDSDETLSSEGYRERCRAFIAEVSSPSEIHKLVLARSSLVPKKYWRAGTYDIIEAIFNDFKETLRWCAWMPSAGFWVGCTPEPLLIAKNGHAQTVSLAGTMRAQTLVDIQSDFSGTLGWDPKNQREQAFVTQFITDTLTPYAQSMQLKGPYSFQTGKLAHLRTDIDFELKAGVALGQVIADLFPTPAVCGTPKAQAEAFILQNEGLDRRYYAGTVGFEGVGQAPTAVYVNLRSMEMGCDGAVFYAGGGIVQGSDPDSEWDETERKMQGLKRFFLA